MAEIAITKVSTRYRDGTVAARDFDLEIGDGEFMILVGPSGPTSLDVVARLDTSSRLAEGTDGRLWLDTSKIHRFDPDTCERFAR